MRRWIILLVTFLMLLGGFGEAQQPKILTICPEGPPVCQFSKIQEAIDSANSDDILLIQAGTYRENLQINKSLRLVATEAGQVRIQGIQPGQPTLTLEVQENFRITLEGLTILGGPPAEGGDSACSNSKEVCPDGIYIAGQGSLVLSLMNVHITQAAVDGVRCKTHHRFQGSAYVSITNSRVAANGGIGFNWSCRFQETFFRVEQVDFSGNLIGMNFSSPGAVIDVIDSSFLGNVTGLRVIPSGKVQLTLLNNSFLHNQWGATIDGLKDSTVTIRVNRFIGNDIGIGTESLLLGVGPEDSVVRIEESSFFANRQYGLVILTANRMSLRNNFIQENGSGLLVYQATNSLELSRNIVRQNREWGVALFRSPCVDDPPFTFPIFIQGQDNEIHDNGKGNLCPEDYNWPPNFIKAP